MALTLGKSLLDFEIGDRVLYREVHADWYGKVVGFQRGDLLIRFDTAGLALYPPNLIWRIHEWKPKGCQHTWTKYVGFTDTFDYCTKCDEKRRG